MVDELASIVSLYERPRPGTGPERVVRCPRCKAPVIRGALGHWPIGILRRAVTEHVAIAHAGEPRPDDEPGFRLETVAP